MIVENYGWEFQKTLFSKTNQDSTFSGTHENSKIFNITSKYFSFFNNKPPANWIAHITKVFLSCYSCSYYSSMLVIKRYDLNYFDYWTEKNIIERKFLFATTFFKEELIKLTINDKYITLNIFYISYFIFRIYNLYLLRSFAKEVSNK